MHHFFADAGQIAGDRITITGPDVNHIKNVLRMRQGEKALIGNKTDRSCVCLLESVQENAAVFRIVGEEHRSTELPARIHLFQGLPKGDKMELIIQKAVELGAYRIIPVETRRTVVRLDGKKRESRIARWNAIAESAAKQSRRQIIPEVANIRSFPDALLMTREYELALIPYECAAGMDLTRALIHSALPGTDIAVFIGPEGGFEEAEAAQAEACGVKAVTLGSRILRTETAGICILSALMLELDREA